jgi:uncharacterized protein YeaC (DUF1315 family)
LQIVLGLGLVIYLDQLVKTLENPTIVDKHSSEVQLGKHPEHVALTVELGQDRGGVVLFLNLRNQFL